MTASASESATLPGFDPPAVPGSVRRNLVGTTLKGTYRIIRRIAEGGMGAVYEAEHDRLHRRVAVKVLLAGLSAEPQAVARFRREAEMLAGLAHPQIVQVFDADETPEGDLYLVMEYLEGETLADRLDRERRLGSATALRIVSRIASALAVIHEQGIVHRDLKPANVFLVALPGDDDFVKLLDFGISRMSTGRRITLDRALIGTPEYMAPEQVESAAAADGASDQFALAVMTHEMLTGRLPFQGETPDRILKAILSAEPEPISRLAPWLGTALDDVVARALRKRPEDRHPSISQFAWALENAALAGGVARHPSSPAVPVGRYSVRPESTDRISPPPSSPTASSSPAATPADRHVERVSRLLGDAIEARDGGLIDDAVFFGEKLLAVASHHPGDEMYALLASALPQLDRIFQARVGADADELVLGPIDPRLLNLTPRAAQLRSLAEGGATVLHIVEASGLPRREAMRFLAGLLRRGALATRARS